ncbi:HEAT repeat protein [Desulfobaculum xiamenense]|uniref:HEAT repeat protein n=1 Tax=Desulfobaculum xiamenense TaxID=995050 RepID=A0A846QMG0_9BACT|nr:DVU0298 family protein [Desulfobaculum xiamenense]NJB69291.1 HEAT repeat protein [Desulfobaculum xiamenense]
MGGFRKLKEQVRLVLSADDWRDRAKELDAQPTAALVGPLFSLLLAPREDVRWRAVTLLGATVARMATQDMEAARVVMRRFMWHMNEESGNVGWGIPESMAETMARHEGLAREFHRKLASYVQCLDCLGDDNYMDHPPLRRAVYWGLGRLAQVRPELVRHALPDLLKALISENDPASRGFICWTIGLVGEPEHAAALESLLRDASPVDLFRDGELEHTTLGALAAEAHTALTRQSPLQ